MKPIPGYGDHMLIEDFIDACKNASFINYDGHGKLATATQMSNIVITPSDIVKGTLWTEDRIYNLIDTKKYTHVVWFNK